MTGSQAIGALQVRRFRQQDEPSVLALLDASLGRGPAGRTAEFFRWKHQENVFGPSFMWVAEMDDRIVGLRAFMQWRFRSGDRRLTAVRAVDTATHPDYQGKGIFSRLTLDAIDELRGEVDFVFNTPNAQSGPGYLKMGWQTVGRLPVWIRVRRPVRFARGMRHLDSTPKPGGRTGSTAAPRAAVELEDLQEVDDLLQRAATSDVGLATLRNSHYLRWRYAQAPALDYRAIALRDRGKLRGLAIFRTRPRGSLAEATIAELIVAAGDTAASIGLLRRVVRAASVDHVTCHLSAVSGGLPGAGRLGFVRAPKGIWLVVNGLTPGLVPDPSQLGSWRVSLGDMEVF